MLPDITQYQLAMQFNIKNCFNKDSELRFAKPIPSRKRKNSIIFNSGAFAVYFPLTVGSKHIAARFFLTQIDELEIRYNCIAKALKEISSKHFIDVEYRKDAVIEGFKTPYIKMEYIDGVSFKKYVEQLILKKDCQKLHILADEWADIIQEMEIHGIAHGDIHPENILVEKSGKIKFVDLDGMYVPELGRYNFESPAVGHPDCQHPKRKKSFFDNKLDRFSSLVIYVSLRAMAFDPTIYNPKVSEHAILLQKDDYLNPDGSEILAHLKNHSNDEISKLSKLIIKISKGTYQDIPKFSDFFNPASFIDKSIKQLKNALSKNDYWGIIKAIQKSIPPVNWWFDVS